MAENCVEIGLVTHINGFRVHLWLMEAREEKLFVAIMKENILKVIELECNIRVAVVNNKEMMFIILRWKEHDFDQFKISKVNTL